MGSPANVSSEKSTKAKTKMEMRISDIDSMPCFFYVILADLPNAPLVNEGALRYQLDDPLGITFPHQFDKNLVPLFKGYVYLLNMPRTVVDLVDFGKERILERNDWHSHAIYVYAIQNVDAVFFRPTLVVAPDNIFPEAIEICQRFSCVLSPVSIGQLDDELVQKHWRDLRDINRSSLEGLPFAVPRPTFRVDTLPVLLPINHRHRQSTFAGPLSRKTINNCFPEGYSLSVTVPGVSSDYKEFLYEQGARGMGCGSLNFPSFEDPENTDSDVIIESTAFSLLSAHSALRDLGVGGVFPAIPQSMFDTLYELEQQVGRKNPDASEIWKTLRSLGRKGSMLLNEEHKDLLRGARTLKVFSNFPLGLMILGDDHDPLQLKCPISYLPLSGLTRVLSYEFRSSPKLSLSKRARILFAELTDPDDPAGKVSRDSTQRILKRLCHTPAIQMKAVEIDRIQELTAILKRMETDILLISAHGGVVEGTNLAGIYCRDKFIQGNEFEAVPPVVILNSCDASPKSLGYVGIVDELLNTGAISVVGTLTPINAYRNSFLIETLFASIAHHMNNNLRSTFLELWWMNTVTWCLYDVLFSDGRLMKWMSNSHEGQSMFEVVGRRLESGGLQHGDVYGSILTVLGEIAQETDFEQHFSRITKNEFIVPEALFYMVYGWPENIST